ncbi:hypothetical protein TNCV_2855991 [Trichonephila clavipes]|nr:hypothetical protein TNCV_2855991 [Trichonephila clavipes]
MPAGWRRWFVAGPLQLRLRVRPGQSRWIFMMQKIDSGHVVPSQSSGVSLYGGNWASKLPAVIGIRLYGAQLKINTSFWECTVAAVAEWYRYRIVAGLVTSSSPVPLKTRCLTEASLAQLILLMTDVEKNSQHYGNVW